MTTTITTRADLTAWIREEPPLFEHDCSICEFLGTYRDGLDLYVCYRESQQTSEVVTLVARSTDEGQDYSSWTLYSWRDVLRIQRRAEEMPVPAEALRRLALHERLA